MPRDRLARYEPFLAIGLAVHGAGIVALGGRPMVGTAAVLAALALVGLVGVTRFDSVHLVTVRSLLLAAVPWAVVVPVAGGSQVTIWFAVAAIVYPVVLRRVFAPIYPAILGLSYLFLTLVSTSPVDVTEIVTRAVLLGGAGYLVWLLTATSVQLAGEREQAQTEARRAQGRFRAAFANASSGMAMIGLEGEILQANQALSDFLQRPVEALPAADWWETIHPEDRGEVRRQVGMLMAAEIWSFQREVRWLRPDWRVVWGLLGVSLVTDDAGSPAYLFAHVQDITERMQTEQQLRVSEDHYRNLFGRSPVAIWEQDFSGVGAWLDQLQAAGIADLTAHLQNRPDLVREGIDRIRVLDVNDAAVALVEATSKEDLLRGMPAAMLTDETLEAAIEQFAAVWEGRDRVETRVTSRTLRGRRIDLIVHWVAPVMAGRLDLSKVVVAYADITEYRHTQEALRRIEERLRTVVSAAPIILFALDRHGVFTLSEGEGLSSLGLGAGEAVGRSIFELFRDSPQLIGGVRRSLAGEAFTTSVEIDELHFDTRFTPIWEEGRVAGVIGVANDITARKRASERLEQLVRSKDEFVASVSHELRTPLTAVVGFAQELREGMTEFGTNEVATFVELIAEQSMEVADLVEDLLVAARVDIDNVAVAPEAVAVRDQIDAVLAAWPAERRNRVRVSGDNAKSYADPIRLRQILRNLLTNAERYGGDRIDAEVVDGFEEVTVRVRDDGPGIPERDREKIFEPYHRAHRIEGQPAAVGLGLTVSRQLARLMGGELSYRHEGGYSIFELTLPAIG